MTKWHLRTENFEQPAHQQRITSSATSIVPASSRNSDVSVQMRQMIEGLAAYALRLFSCDMVHCKTFAASSYKYRNHDCFLYHNFSILFLFVRMIVVTWKGHLGYYASGHSDQSSLESFRISIRCTAVATNTDQTARMHKTLRYFNFAVHLRYLDPGETMGEKQNDQWKNIERLTTSHESVTTNWLVLKTLITAQSVVISVN